MNKKLNEHIKKMSFGTQLLLSILSVIIMAFFIIGGLFVGIMQKRLKEDAIINMQDVVGRTQYYIESHLNSVYNLFSSLESDPSLYNLKNGLHDKRIGGKVAQYYLDLDILLKSAVSSNQNSLEAIYINFNDGALMVQKFAHYALNVNFDFERWHKKYPESKIYFRAIQEEPDISGSESSAIIFRLYEAKDINGIILYSIKSNFFKDILGQLKIYDNSEFYILTEKGERLEIMDYEYRQELPDQAVRSIISSSENKIILTSGQQYIYAVPIENTGWRLVLRVPEKDVMKNAVLMWKNYVVIASISVVVLCLLITVVTKHISTPLLTLAGKIVEMKNRNLRAEFNVDGCREIDILNRELHRMHDYSVELMEEIKQERDLKRKAELTMLQEQIKPHFLYNSLYSIQQLCETGENDQAARMIGALSSFYRLGISGGNDIITIEEELKHADHYLQIQKMRYSDRFDYIIDCDPVIYPFEIPKLVLQPLVENAIYHGIKQSVKKGFVSITGDLDGEDIILEVHDDGVGMGDQELEQLRKILANQDKTDSIGLKNVNYRIKNCYGEGYGIWISSEKEIDTCIRLRIARQIKK